MNTRLQWLIEIMELIASKDAEPTSVELCVNPRGTGVWKYWLAHEDPTLPYDYAHDRITKEEFYQLCSSSYSLAIIVYYDQDPNFRHHTINNIRIVNGKTQLCFQKSLF